MQRNEISSDPDDDSINLMEVFSCLLRKRKQVLIFTIILAIFFFGIVFWSKCQYSSEGFLRAPRKFTEFNAQKAAFVDKGILRRFLEANKLQDNPNGQYLLGSLSEKFLQQHVQVVLPYSKDDLRYMGEAKIQPDPVSLGFSISFMSRTPAQAQERVRIVGDFMKDTMLLQELVETVRAAAADAKIKQQQIDNQLIQKKLALDEAIDKLQAVQAIAVKYPEASKLEARQLLSTTGEGSKYLSPVAQLVGIESEIADIKNRLTRLQRDTAQNALRNQFYSRADDISRRPETGKAMLADFVAAYKDVFKDKDLANDQTREVYNQIALFAEQMQTKHLTEPRFVSGPTLPDHRSGPGVLLLALLSLFGGLLLSCVTVLSVDAIRQSNAGGAPVVHLNKLAA